MNPDSRATIYMGVNFAISPPPVIGRQMNVRFQENLIREGIEFSKIGQKEEELVVIREAPTPLQAIVRIVPGAPVGQLLILAPNSQCTLALFAKEAEAVARAFDSTWPQEKRQIISCDATLRDLFEASGEHAFKELWETRLHQSPESFSALGRLVLGGGLRFVMPPPADEPEAGQIEVKIESFLRDTKMIFVETQYTWSIPRPPGARFDPQDLLRRVDEYVESAVVSFITGGSQ